MPYKIKFRTDPQERIVRLLNYRAEPVMLDLLDALCPLDSAREKKKKQGLYPTMRVNKREHYGCASRARFILVENVNDKLLRG